MQAVDVKQTWAPIKESNYCLALQLEQEWSKVQSKQITWKDEESVQGPERRGGQGFNPEKQCNTAIKSFLRPHSLVCHARCLVSVPSIENCQHNQDSTSKEIQCVECMEF